MLRKLRLGTIQLSNYNVPLRDLIVFARRFARHTMMQKLHSTPFSADNNAGPLSAENNFKLSAGASYLHSRLQSSSAIQTHNLRTKTDSSFADCAADILEVVCSTPLLVILRYLWSCYAQAEASWYKQCCYLMSWWAGPVDTSSAGPAHGICVKLCFSLSCPAQRMSGHSHLAGTPDPTQMWFDP